MKIAVVGGGPGGLFFALLVKKQNPDFSVRVFERNPEGATFGFGVALHGQGWEFFKSGDADCIDQMVAASEVFYGQTVRHKNQDIFYSDTQPNAGIERVTLIRILEQRARQLGVEVQHHIDINEPSQLADYDLIVGADGVNSIVRQWHEKEYGVSSRELTSRMAWYGVDKKISPAKLAFKKTIHGYFWCVVYPHSGEHSTFVAECEERAYINSGLERMTEEQQVAFTENIFREELGGGRILYNKSIWRALPVTRTQRWWVGNTVLLGDALHSPHPSIGSGTRLSMDDAFALAGSLSAHREDLKTALEDYRCQREPTKQKLVKAMEDSLEWYETIGQRLDGLSAEEAMFDWIARTGRVSETRIADIAPEFHRRYGEQFARYLLHNAG